MPFCAYCGTALGQVSYANCPSCGNPSNGAPRTAATSSLNPTAIIIGVAAAGLVVLAIIGILAAIAIPNLLTAMERARQRQALADIRAVSAAVQTYASEHQGRYPDAVHIEQLQRQLNVELPTDDPWEHQYRYDCWSASGFGPCDHYGVASAGKDQKFTSDDLRAYIGRGATKLFIEDIVLVDGDFVQYPEGL